MYDPFFCIPSSIYHHDFAGSISKWNLKVQKYMKSLFTFKIILSTFSKHFERRKCFLHLFCAYYNILQVESLCILVLLTHLPCRSLAISVCSIKNTDLSTRNNHGIIIKTDELKKKACASAWNKPQWYFQTLALCKYEIYYPLIALRIRPWNKVIDK